MDVAARCQFLARLLAVFATTSMGCQGFMVSNPHPGSRPYVFAPGHYASEEGGLRIRIDIGNSGAGCSNDRRTLHFCEHRDTCVGRYGDPGSAVPTCSANETARTAVLRLTPNHRSLLLEVRGEGCGVVDPRRVVREAQVFLRSLPAACVEREQAESLLARLTWALPMSFDDTLYHRHGFSHPQYDGESQPPEVRYFDLSPGMRVRLQLASFLPETALAQDAGTHLHAFENGTSVELDIGRGPDGKLNFDAFLARAELRAAESPTGAPSCRGVGATRMCWASGPLELVSVASRREAYRVFYPPSFNAMDAQATYTPDTNVVLVGANREGASSAAQGLEEITDVADQQPRFEALCGQTRFICLVFPGRTLLVPEIPVTLNGERRFVRLGTTLRNVIDGTWDFELPRSEPPPPGDPTRLGSDRMPAGITVRRRYLGRYVDMEFDTGVWGALELPLVMGDSVRW